MKKIIILHSYPNNEKQLNVLSKCLDILKNTGYDTMLVSHFPVPSEVYKKTNYYLFDEDNTLLPEGVFPPYYYNMNGFEVTINYKGHTLPITRSMRKSVSFVKALGYDFFWFMEADCHFSDGDLARFDALRDQMFKEEKDMIFFKPKGFREHRFNSQVYETLIFGGKPLYFLAKWKPPTTLEEWNANNMSHMLEYDFYVKYGNDENNFIIVDEHSSDYFNTSQINIFRYNLFACELLSTLDPTKVTLFMYNSNYNKGTYKLVIKLNDNVIAEPFFCQGCWQHNTFDINGDILSVEVYEDDIYIETKTFLLTEENLHLFIKQGTFKYN